MGEIFVYSTIAILFGLLILVFLYIYILCSQFEEYENEHNFRKYEKNYKPNESFLIIPKKGNKNRNVTRSKDAKKAMVKKNKWFRRIKKAHSNALKECLYFKNNEDQN